MNPVKQCGFARAGYLIALLSAVVLPFSAAAQGTLFTLFTNGPTAKRINIVVLAEGYTAGQTNQFLTDATSTVNNLLGQEPYQEYKNYFNAFAIFVASAESGSDHPISGTFKNTYFNSTFDSYDIPQLITIPPNQWTSVYPPGLTYGDNNSANGQGKVTALLQALMPEYDLPVMVVNDLDYGGSGDTGNSTTIGTMITSRHVFAPEIIVHESGHALGGLTDEYTNAYAFTTTEKPNATAITSSNSIKWKAWIPSGTLIPTPDDATNDTRVGLFQGAQYHATGWYRPKRDCKMNHLFVPFCEVCSEQLVKSVYSLVRPIDSFTPPVPGYGIYGTQAVAFSVTTLQPLTHNLNIQWFTNNAAVPGATEATYNVVAKLLGNGAHTLKAVVSDGTSLVRTDPAKLLKQTNSWNLTVSLNELALVSARYLDGNRFRFTVTGAAPAGFVIQASTNLTQWTALATNTLSGGKYDFTNANLTNLTRRFYRTLSPP